MNVEFSCCHSLGWAIARRFGVWTWPIALAALAWWCVPVSDAAAWSAGAGHVLTLPIVLAGQDSLLDLAEEEEEEGPATAPPPKSAPLPKQEGQPGPPLPEGPPLPPADDGGSKRQPRPDAGDEESDESQTGDVFDKLHLDGRSWRVKLRRDLIRSFAKGESYVFTALNPSGKGYHVLRKRGDEIVRITYYEEHMLQRAAEQFGVNDYDLSREGVVFGGFDDPERARAAQRAIATLQTAIAEHDSAVQRSLRIGTGWRKLRQPLARAWFNLNRSRVEHLLDQGQNARAIAECDRLLEHPALEAGSYQAIRNVLERLFLEPAERAIDTKDYAEARRLIEEFERRYPLDPGGRVNDLRSRLIRIAQEIADRAKTSSDTRLLDEAAAVWPQLSCLDEYRRGIATSYPVLRCAYSSLPTEFSPLTARTLVDRHAVSLMFEGLVRWRYDPRIGPHYAAQLAESRPVPLARGRQFHLPRCVWGVSQAGAANLCTREDVFFTIKLLKQKNPPEFPNAWERLIGEVNAQGANDPFCVSICLRHDYWQPLSLMDFMVVPKYAFPGGGREEEIRRFDANPIGTGPYRLRRDSASSPNEIRFVANPFYRTEGLPKIREIVFLQLDAIEAMRAFPRDVQLIYGVRPTHVVQLRNEGKQVVTLKTPSVCFLAPNYYARSVLHNANLRLALAHAIDRDAILNTCFRPGAASTDHKPLNGPFPVGSWAYNRQVPALEPANASAFMKKAAAEIKPSGDIKLRLIYPSRDAQDDVSRACSEIKKTWEAALQVAVDLKPLQPAEFCRRIALADSSWELAYCRHDFRDETYWIWPWFDPESRGPGGSNFMGFVPDNDLQDLFRQMLVHKQFNEIRRAAHQIHQSLASKAVIIPLWQLDTYVAVSPQLLDKESRPIAFDRFRFFEGVENWTLRVE